jgi:hypothetical protein
MKSFYQFYNLLETCTFTQANLRHIQDLEKEIYPPNMQFWQDDENEDDWRASFEQMLDIAEYEEDEIDCIIQPDWYALLGVRSNTVEIIDLASRRKLNVTDFKTLYSKLLSFGNKIFKMNARLTTSYPIIKNAEKKGYLRILMDEPTSLFGEPMREIEFILLGKAMRQNKFRGDNVSNQQNFGEWLSSKLAR